MARRVEALLAPAGLRPPLVATFHAVCVRMLRQHVRHLGYPPHFTIYDDDDRRPLVKECMRAEGLEDSSVTPGRGGAPHQRGQEPDADRGRFEKAARGPREERLAAVYRRYQARLVAAGGVDFDDLLLLTVRLLDEVPEVLAWYRGLWRHVLVDEYQDTNRVQYRIIRLLTGAHRNVCCVGDPDQSIYKWRGADIRNILDFERDYPGHARGPARAELPLHQAHPGGGRGGHRQQPGAQGQGAVDGDRGGRAPRALSRLGRARGGRTSSLSASWPCARGGPRLRDMAVFYRTNAQSRVLEDALRRAACPTTSWAASASTSARRSRTSWPTCASS